MNPADMRKHAITLTLVNFSEKSPVTPGVKNFQLLKYEILWRIPQIDKGGIQTKGPMTRKLMTHHKALHTSDVTRKEGKREFVSIEECADASTRGIKRNTKNCKERLIRAASNSKGKIITNRKTTKNTKQKWKEKQFYRYFKL